MRNARLIRPWFKAWGFFSHLGMGMFTLELVYMLDSFYKHLTIDEDSVENSYNL